MKKGLPLALGFLAMVLAAPTPSQASDHIDGLKTALDNAADLTDVFAFTSPRDPTKLVLIMDVHGIAFSGSRFSNAVDYKFRIRQVDPQTKQPNADPRNEATIVCNFSGLLVFSNQHATCKVDIGGTTDFVTFDTRGPGFKAGGAGEKNGVKVFAGVRSDPWFLDLARTLEFNAGKQVGTGPGINGLHGQNVLSIVVEVDKKRVGGPLIAVTAQTVRK